MTRNERRLIKKAQKKAAKKGRKVQQRITQQAKSGQIPNGLMYAGFWYKADLQSVQKGWEWIWAAEGLYENHPHACQMPNLNEFVATLYESTQGWLDAEAASGNTLANVIQMAHDEVENVLDFMRNDARVHDGFTMDSDHYKAMLSFSMNVLVLDTFRAIPDDEMNGTKFGWMGAKPMNFRITWNGA